jgi:hypothetical protein
MNSCYHLNSTNAKYLDGLRADVGVLHYHGIRGSKLALDAVVSRLFGVPCPPSPKAALSRVEKTKFDKYSEGMQSRPDINFIHFAVTEFGTLSGHTTASMTKLAMHAPAYEMHVGMFLVSSRRTVSLAVLVAHADNVWRGLSVAVDGVGAAPSSAWIPSHCTALFTRAMGCKRLRISSRGA